jgi:hypothetical protein
LAAFPFAEVAVSAHQSQGSALPVSCPACQRRTLTLTPRTNWVRCSNCPWQNDLPHLIAVVSESHPSRRFLQELLGEDARR